MTAEMWQLDKKEYLFASELLFGRTALLLIDSSDLIRWNLNFER
jgi:hypothetical protein